MRGKAEEPLVHMSDPITIGPYPTVFYLPHAYEEPAHRIMSYRDPRAWTMPRAARVTAVSSGGCLEGDEHGGTGVCLGDGQMEA